MKPKPNKPTAKLPRARVMYQDPSGACWFYAGTCKAAVPAAVIPTHTAAQARQICKAAKFLQLSPEEQREFLSFAIQDELGRSDSPFNAALECLRVMGLGGGK